MTLVAMATCVPQEHEAELAEQLVALINLDGAVAGRDSLLVQASPLMRGVIRDAAKQVRDAVRKRGGRVGL